MYNIEFYEDANGKSELWDFIENLRIKAATNKDAHIQHKQIDLYIQLLQDNGTRLSPNILKMIFGNYDQGIIEFYIFILKMILLYFCISFVKRHQSVKLNEQKQSVMIILVERRVNNYENMEWLQRSCKSRWSWNG